MNQETSDNSQSKELAQGSTKITVSGYKSIYEECSIEVRPLTILAGANSSGKSSMMQPLLLLKQTLEAPYDPGPLKIDGPNVRFTSFQQLFSHIDENKSSDIWSIGMEINKDWGLINKFKLYPDRGIDILEMFVNEKEEERRFAYELSAKEMQNLMPEKLRKTLYIDRVNIFRNRCFLDVEFEWLSQSPQDQKIYGTGSMSIPSIAVNIVESYILGSIHVPGWRGNPAPSYKTTAIGSYFPGHFQDYVASVVKHWQETKDKRLDELEKALETLGLTWKVDAKKIDDTQVELRVGRLPNSGQTTDTINIADVGFGVSQVLPVLVALILAEPKQLVYLEQPELHLHPRAQAGLAQILADAADRGVLVIAETHSELLLLAVQSLVAEGKLSPDKVKLHWFTRGEDGVTEVSSADLDEAGAFGDWPEDFDDVSLKLENRYLSAAESRMWERSHGS
ncbi:MAG: AAA family ATPase [Hormoscilla sp. GM7CHS1pb]|nr:AAA family ATPase [Hormoscilla sp. GM7CHS1pb]